MTLVKGLVEPKRVSTHRLNITDIDSLGDAADGSYVLSDDFAWDSAKTFSASLCISVSLHEVQCLELSEKILELEAIGCK